MKTVKELIAEKKLPRQLKDPKKEMEVAKVGKVIVIDKKDWKTHEAQGWVIAESNLDEAKDLMSKVQKPADAEKRRSTGAKKLWQGLNDIEIYMNMLKKKNPNKEFDAEIKRVKDTIKNLEFYIGQVS